MQLVSPLLGVQQGWCSTAAGLSFPAASVVVASFGCCCWYRYCHQTQPHCPGTPACLLHPRQIGWDMGMWGEASGWAGFGLGLWGGDSAGLCWQQTTAQSWALALLSPPRDPVPSHPSHSWMLLLAYQWPQPNPSTQASIPCPWGFGVYQDSTHLLALSGA